MPIPSLAPEDCEALAGVYSDITAYYTGKINRYGATPLGVDWSCVPTQELRFVQLLKVCDFRKPFTLNDLGCGYGALLAFLGKRYPKKAIDYQGIDLSAEMIAQAQRLWAKRSATEFLHRSSPQRLADYSIASGIFNVRLHQPQALWVKFIQTTLMQLHASSRRGFAVNFLAPVRMAYSPVELYRADPALWCAYCESVLQAKVDIIADYGMPEYTLLVRKAGDAIASG